MALSPKKLRAYRPLLAVLVAELVAEYEAEQQTAGAVEQTSPAGTDATDAAPAREVSS